MAAIYKAVDRLTGATVAIKVPFLRLRERPDLHARFILGEEEIGRRLSHPNIIRVLKPRQKSRLYIVTEYVNGVPLRSLMKHGEPWEPERALTIVRQIAEALVYLHGQHVVHRDLKPQNILVTPDGKIKIVDFGIALDHPGRRLTWLGSDTLGTAGVHMAPGAGERPARRRAERSVRARTDSLRNAHRPLAVRRRDAARLSPVEARVGSHSSHTVPPGPPSSA